MGGENTLPNPKNFKMILKLPQWPNSYNMSIYGLTKHFWSTRDLIPCKKPPHYFEEKTWLNISSPQYSPTELLGRKED